MPGEQDRLSPQEMTYAREYFVMMGRAFKDALLDHLPACVPGPALDSVCQRGLREEDKHAEHRQPCPFSTPRADTLILAK